jgi:hypothetical protein
MSDVLNPVAVESAIRECANRIANGVKVCSDRYRDYLKADHDLDIAYARAFMAHEGPQTEKRYAAELATEKERQKRDLADAAYRYADRQNRALQAELDAYRSIGASVRSAYAVAGRGEGA